MQKAFLFVAIFIPFALGFMTGDLNARRELTRISPTERTAKIKTWQEQLREEMKQQGDAEWTNIPESKRTMG